MSYVQLDSTLFYGIHPGIVHPGREFDHYVILTTPDQHDHLPTEWSIGKHMIYHPIVDRKAPPTLNEYTKLISKLCHLEGDVYIACRGGHGRSGLVAAGVYATRHKTTYNQTVRHTNKEWRSQRDLSYIRPKIQKLGSPQTRNQKEMLKKYIESLK